MQSLSRETQELVHKSIREQLLPFARKHFPHLNGAFDKQPYPRPGNLFIVRYSAASGRPGGRGLKLHKDETALTFNICLSPQDGFEGGGTYFPAAASDRSCDVDGLLVRPCPGHCLVHDGNIKHAGNDVTSGDRYILVGFYNADGRDRAGEECYFGKKALAEAREQLLRCPPLAAQTVYFTTATAAHRGVAPSGSVRISRAASSGGERGGGASAAAASAAARSLSSGGGAVADGTSSQPTGGSGGVSWGGGGGGGSGDGDGGMGAADGAAADGESASLLPPRRHPPSPSPPPSSLPPLPSLVPAPALVAHPSTDAAGTAVGTATPPSSSSLHGMGGCEPRGGGSSHGSNSNGLRRLDVGPTPATDAMTRPQPHDTYGGAAAPTSYGAAAATKAAAHDRSFDDQFSGWYSGPPPQGGGGGGGGGGTTSGERQRERQLVDGSRVPRSAAVALILVGGRGSHRGAATSSVGAVDADMSPTPTRSSSNASLLATQYSQKSLTCMPNWPLLQLIQNKMRPAPKAAAAAGAH